jgi:hypothetical protein
MSSTNQSNPILITRTKYSCEKTNGHDDETNRKALLLQLLLLWQTTEKNGLLLLTHDGSCVK